MTVSARARFARRLGSAALGCVLLACVAFYLAQAWRVRPNEADDGLLLDTIHRMSLGARPYWDIVDAYGLFNWPFPVAFYVLAGQKVWGLRLWLVLLKTISVWIGYRSATALSDRFYGLLAASGLMVLLGQPWPSLQATYAFLTVIPLVLGTWHVLLVQPCQRAWLNWVLAALLTTLVIWTKVNTGAFLFAGGLFTLLFWAGPLQGADADRARPSEANPRSRTGILRARLLAVFGYAVVFSAYVSRHYEFLYFVYLLGPLFLLLGWAGYTALAERSSGGLGLTPALVYAGSTLAGSACVLFGYYGFRGAFAYLRELSALLAVLNYHSAFAPIGKPLMYVGFNENYWPQLPWLLTFLFVVWLILQRHSGPRAFYDAWPKQRARASGLFLLATLYCFVLYPRADDMHIYQGLPGVIFALFVLLHQIERFVRYRLPRVGAHFREGLALAVATYLSTITARPSLDILTPTPGDYANPRMEYLQYSPLFDYHVHSFSTGISERDWDESVDRAARYVDEITLEDEPILVQSDQRLIHYLSRTHSVGGRYATYWYLVSVGLLDRSGFDRITPRSVLENILKNPPRVLVLNREDSRFDEAFPELHSLREQRYVEAQAFAATVVYRLK